MVPALARRPVAIHTCGVGQPPITWRPILPARVFGVFWVAFMCFGTVAVVIGLARGEGIELLPGLAVFPTVGVLGWKLSMGSWLRLTATEVIVCNPFEFVRIPLQDVVGVSAGSAGLAIILANGSLVRAWAVQQTNLASWFHWHTRADDVGDAILAAAGAVRDAVGVSQTGHEALWLAARSPPMPMTATA